MLDTILLKLESTCHTANIAPLSCSECGGIDHKSVSSLFV